MNKEEYEKLKEFYDSIKRLVRNTGKSSMVSVQDIEELLNEYY